MMIEHEIHADAARERVARLSSDWSPVSGAAPTRSPDARPLADRGRSPALLGAGLSSRA